MKKRGFYHPQVNYAISTLGHGDLLMVTDGGYPTPLDNRRIDLAIAPNIPELRDVLTILNQEIFIEQIIVAQEMLTNNPKLYQWIEENFKGIEMRKVPHKPNLADIAKTAKWFIRTGAMDPWGNIGLVCGVNWKLVLQREGVIIPEGAIHIQNE